MRALLYIFLLGAFSLTANSQHRFAGKRKFQERIIKAYSFDEFEFLEKPAVAPFIDSAFGLPSPMYKARTTTGRDTFYFYFFYRWHLDSVFSKIMRTDDRQFPYVHGGWFYDVENNYATFLVYFNNQPSNRSITSIIDLNLVNNCDFMEFEVRYDVTITIGDSFGVPPKKSTKPKKKL